ncbi:MAG: EpsI family protein [Armatimonas sp.]
MKSKRYIIINVILLATLFGLYGASRTTPPDGAYKDCLKGLTLPFRDWNVEEQFLTDRENEMLRPDTVLLRQYSSYMGEQVGLAIVAGHRKQTVHTPAFCMAGGGWNALSQSEQNLKLGDTNIETVRSIMEAQGKRILVTYFFTDGTNSQRSLPAFQTTQFLQRLKGYPSWGALVRISVPIGSSQSDAENLSNEFARTTLPTVLQRLRDARPGRR